MSSLDTFIKNKQTKQMTQAIEEIEVYLKNRYQNVSIKECIANLYSSQYFCQLSSIFIPETPRVNLRSLRRTRRRPCRH